MTLPPFIQRMSARERVLAGIVAGVLLLLVNLFLWSWLLGSIRTARGCGEAKNYAQRTASLSS